MGMIERSVLPVMEDGDAPRLLATNIIRMEKVSAGVFCFVMTRDIILERARIRRVNCYLDVTSEAIVDGLGLLMKNAPSEFAKYLLPRPLTGRH